MTVSLTRAAWTGAYLFAIDEFLRLRIRGVLALSGSERPVGLIPEPLIDPLMDAYVRWARSRGI